MRRKILIADGEELNCKLLESILEPEYDVATAKDGAEAFAELVARRGEFAAVMLDTVLPKQSGFEVLRMLRQTSGLSRLPVIVVTESDEEEERAVSLGANDCVTKPYNPVLILHSLRNVIKQHETASLIDVLNRDKLTGLYNREAFFEKADELIREKPAGYYIMACCDIDNFKLVNDQYGSAEGDRILRHTARAAKELFESVGGISARISNDNFAALYPADDATVELVTKRLFVSLALPKGMSVAIVFSTGRYIITDKSLSASASYDRAYIAKRSVKGRYDEHIAYFDETMREKLINEQTITGEMGPALAAREFEVWFQPQFNHATGALIGAEALVRWRHPERGLIPPDEFIPVFEKNGFVYELDKFVWEETCRLLRDWRERGLEPAPLSVNISRYDVFRPELTDVITELLKKYAIPVELLRLEITESAFAKSSAQIIAVVKKLIERGFTMEIDDFGSGYSSLNTLKDVPADILKLDMRFLENTENSQRGGNIVESVVRMAKWLGMSVIAEGVETREQADYLKSIGCNYIQGFLYSRPIPAADFEKLMKRAGKEERLLSLETVENLDNNSFWDPKSMETLIFNSYIGGACIFEYHGGKVEILRANDKYAQVIGSAGMTVETALRLNWGEHLDEANRLALTSDIRRSTETGEEFTDEFVFLDLPGCPHETYLRTTMRVIARSGDHYLVYCTNENITRERQAENKERRTSEQLMAIMSNISGGVTATIIADRKPRLLFANSQYYAQLGYTKQEFEEDDNAAINTIHPDDRERVLAEAQTISDERGQGMITYRVVRRDGTIRWIQSNISVIKLQEVDEPVQLAVTNDITGQREAAEKERRASEQVRVIMEDAASGITATVLRDGQVGFIMANNKYYEILGFTREQYAAEVTNVADLIYPDDRERVFRGALASYEKRGTEKLEYRVIRRDGTMRWVRAVLSNTSFTGIEQPVQIGIFADITQEKQAQQALVETDEQLKFLNDTAHDFLAEPDCDKAIGETLRRLLDYFAGNRAYVFEFDYNKHTSNNTYEVCAEGIQQEIDNLQNVPMEIMSFWLHAFDGQSNVNITDVDALDDSRADERRALSAQGIKSLIAVPLWREGKLIGFVGIDDPSKQQSRLSRLAAIGDYIAVMLTRRDLTAKISSDNKVLSGLMNDIPGGFVRMRMLADGGIVPIYFNEGFCKLVGMKLGELFALYEKDAFAGVHPDDVWIVREAVGRMLENGEAHSSQYRLRHGRGGYISTIIFGRVTTDGSGDKYLNIYYTDATGQNKLAQERRELLDNIPCGAAIYEYDGSRMYAIHMNKRYRELVRREVRSSPDISVVDSVHPDDRAPMLTELQLSIREGRDAACNIRVLCGKDQYRLFHIVGRIVPKDNGKYSIYAVYTQVLEDEVYYQQMLPVALTTVMESSSDLSFVKDREHRYICCSRAFADAAGLVSERDVIGKTDYDLLDKEMADKYSAVDADIIATGRARLDYDETLPNDGRGMRYGQTSKYPLLDTTGRVIGIYGVTRDVTEYHTAFDRLRLLTNNIPGGIASFEIKGDALRIVYFNEGFYAYSGYSREEFAQLCAQDPMFLVLPEDIPAARRTIDAITSGSDAIPECTYRCRTRSGECRWFSMKGMLSERQGGACIVNAVQFDITERKASEERLRVSEEQFRIAAALGDRTVARYDIRTRRYYNDSELLLKQGFGRIIENAPQAFIDAGAVEPSSAAELTELYDKMRGGAQSATATAQLRVPGGGFRWFRLDATVVFDAERQPYNAIIVFYDVTEQREKEAVYRKWQQSLQTKPTDSYTLFRCNLSTDAPFESQEGTLLKFDFGVGSASFDAQTLEYAEKLVHADDREEYIATLKADTLLANYYRGKCVDTLEYRELTGNGGVRWLRRTTELVEYPDSTDLLAYLMFENIDAEKLAELQTKELAETDPLTGILNRKTFAEKMERLLAEGGAQAALLMFDIDGFKLLNDSFGHATGDQALIDIADKLRSILRHGDLLGRLGGDEFLVCLKNIQSRAATGKKARHICNLLRKSFSVEVRMSASLGIAMAPSDGSDFETLYHKADTALYHVKATGKDNYAFYDASMDGEKPSHEQDTDEHGASAGGVLKRRMLIVEDNRLNRDLLVGMFKDEFIIDTANDGNSALIRLRRYGAGISIVLLDLIMPGMDGFAVLEKMRSSQEMQSIPVIVVSGMDERETALRTIKCGASDFITKPVDPDLLRLRVQSAVSKAENERLRAQNSFLALQGDEVARYKAVLETDGIVLAEYDRTTETFSYDAAMAQYIAGTFDNRTLWLLLISDGVASEADVSRLRELVHRVSENPAVAHGSASVTLKTPSGQHHRFSVKVIKRTDEFQLGDKLLLTFTDTEL